MLELFDKDFIAAIIIMFQKEIKNTLKANGKMGSISEEIASLRKDIENLKKDQMEILELKIK